MIRRQVLRLLAGAAAGPSWARAAAPVIAYDPRREALLWPQRRDPVWQAGAVLSVTQWAVEAARLAYLRAEQSSTEAQRLEQALQRAGCAAPQWFSDAGTGSEAFGTVRSADGAVLIAFRGTQPDAVRDLLADVHALPVAWDESGGRVHAGFAAAARALLPALQAWCARTVRPGCRLVLTGHSLGGALAVLAGSVLKPARVITLGTPRVGDAGFAAGVRALACTRIVNCCDLVTRLPPPGPWFTHSGERLYIDQHGQVQAGAGAALIASDQPSGRSEYRRLWSATADALPLRDLADHAPINYVRAFY